MTSNRPTSSQRFLEFDSEVEEPRGVPEPQRGQSVSAAMKKTTLSPVSENLMEQIVDQRNMERAWKNVKANRGAPGPDGVTLDEFFETFRDQWPTVRQQLLEGTYEPDPARRKSIPKPDGSERHLGIPNVQERLIQQAILQVLTPIFDPEFSASSFGFRPNRSAQQAAKQVQDYIRAGYADDFLVFTKTREAARRVYISVGRYLTRKLKLVVNRQKSRICGTDGVEFVGFIFVGYGGQIRVSPKNIQKFKDRVRQITRRKRGVSMARRYQELRWYFQGWVGYFRLVPIKSFYSELDKWVRRRFRSCYWKQWKNPRTRIANLKKLGIREKEAVTHGVSSKGPWVMSSSQAVHEALSVAFLQESGLASLLEIWSKLTAKKRIA